MKQCENYYKSNFSFSWDFDEVTFGRVIQLDLWNNVDPVSVAGAIQFLGIPLEKPRLFWLAKLYLALPLPPGFEVLTSSNDYQSIYLNTNSFQKLRVKPCHLYIKDILRRGIVEVSKLEKFEKIIRDKDERDRLLAIDHSKMVFNRSNGDDYTVCMSQLIESLNRSVRFYDSHFKKQR